MGWKRVIGSGIAGMLCLIPMAYISFRFLNLGEGITGGLIQNIDDALGSISSLIGAGGIFIELIVGALIGVALIFLFPIHWCIFYRPEDIMLILAVTLPWILCCVITCGIFARSPKQGIHTSLAIGIGYAIVLVIVYFILIAILGSNIILDGILIGLTDLPYLLAVLTAVFEGCLVGTVFGGFVGSLKYKPKGGKGKRGKSRGKVEVSGLSEESRAIESSVLAEETSCSNCGAKLTIDELFCTNCGAKST
ncbi:MAG: zinc ribbon domain-containing protein [Candidatus Lokiarchaeota archaeon]|nr:zinc ribbon domain-containing protein [Candidatus Lokiarchaeota archaeon]